MNDLGKYFDVEFFDNNDKSQIIVIDIKEFDNKLKEIIDKCLVPICETDTDIEIKYIKKRLSDFLKSKRGSSVETGAVAEFFIHLCLNQCGYTQEFTFFNLEERSIKKGFDGYYSFNGEEWIMESKSGDSSTKKINHKMKITEAYNDLSHKFTGKGENNPWQNAYNHAKVVGSNQNIINKIKELKIDYLKEHYYSIDKFNIIPCSSIFTSSIAAHKDKVDIVDDIKLLLPIFNYKKIKAICVSNITKMNFIKYIDDWED